MGLSSGGFKAFENLLRPKGGTVNSFSSAPSANNSGLFGSTSGTVNSGGLPMAGSMQGGLFGMGDGASSPFNQQYTPTVTNYNPTSGFNPNALSSFSPVNASPTGYGEFRLSPNTFGARNFSNVFDVQSGDTDYAKAAKLTAQGNLAAAQAQATANRVNQINPYGSIQYYQTGVDAQGNPQYSAAASLSPEQQALLNAQNYQSMGLAQTANQALPSVYNTYTQAFDINPFVQGQLPRNLQQNLDMFQGMSGWNRASNLMMQRLAPQMQRQEDRLEQQLANQGISRGSEAYTRAKQDLAMQQNDLLNQAQLEAQNVQQNLFNQELAAGQFGNQAMLAQQQANNAARQGNFQLASYLRGLPLQELNALRAGSQVTNPSFIGVPQSGQVAGPDMLSAYQAQQNANIAAQNRQAAQQSNLTSGLFSLGGSLLGNIGGVTNTVGNVLGGVGRAASNVVSGIGNAVSSIFRSDPRTKENIKAIGVMDNGLTLYSFEYKDEFKDDIYAGHGVHVGVMADEVEQVFPYAVSTLNDGYKVVDYSLLP